MGNQFDARMIWHRREVWTVDEETGAAAVIRNMADGSDRPFAWWIQCGTTAMEGRARSEQAARNAVRARVVKLPAKEGADANRVE